MYYVSKMDLDVETRSTLVVDLKGADLISFFCLENGRYFRLALSDKTGTNYSLNKTTHEPFDTFGNIVFYALPIRPPDTFTNNRAFYEYAIAYATHSKYIGTVTSLLEELGRLVQFPKVVEELDFTDYLEYYGILVDKVKKNDVVALGNGTSGTLVIKTELKGSDNLLVVRATEALNSFICLNAEILTDYIIYDQAVVAFNFSNSFKPTHFFRCSNEYTKFNKVQIPIDVESTKPLRYRISTSETVGDILKNTNPFYKYNLVHTTNTVLNKGDTVSNKDVFILKSANADAPSNLIFNGLVGTDIEFTGTVRLNAGLGGLPKFTVSFPADFTGKLQLIIDSPLASELKPQLVFLSGLEEDNDSWVRSYNSMTKTTTFVSANTIKTLSPIEMTIGWRLDD